MLYYSSTAKTVEMTLKKLKKLLTDTVAYDKI